MHILISIVIVKLGKLLMNNILLVFFLLVTTFTVKAQDADLSEYEFYFVNGVFNTLDQAEVSQALLKTRYSKLSELKLLHNDTRGWIGGLDILDTMLEKNRELSMDMYWRGIRDLGYADEQFVTAYAEVIGLRKNVGIWSRANFDSMLPVVRASLQAGKKVVLIAHSQGNMFYKNIHDQILLENADFRKCFAGVGIATPLSTKNGIYDYTTSTNDRVMQLVRIRYGALAANIAIPQSYNGDHSGHKLKEVYLDHPISISSIGATIDSTIDELNDSCPPMQFDISVTVSAGSAPESPLFNITNLDAKNLSGNLKATVTHSSGAVNITDLGQRTIKSGASNSHILNIDPLDAGTNTIIFSMVDSRGRVIAKEEVQHSVAPTIACGAPISKAGGSERFTSSLELGSAEGDVQVSFEAFHIPDSLTISRRGRTEVSTNGEISGSRSYKFHHDPKKEISNTVDIEVIGNKDEETAWNLTVGCPNDQLVTYEPHVNVSIVFSSKATRDCDLSVFVDGQLAFRGGGASIGDQISSLELAPGTHQASRSGSCSVRAFSGGYYRFHYTDSTGKHSLPRNGLFTVQ